MRNSDRLSMILRSSRKEKLNPCSIIFPSDSFEVNYNELYIQAFIILQSNETFHIIEKQTNLFENIIQELSQLTIIFLFLIREYKSKSFLSFVFISEKEREREKKSRHLVPNHIIV